MNNNWQLALGCIVPSVDEIEAGLVHHGQVNLHATNGYVYRLIVQVDGFGNLMASIDQLNAPTHLDFSVRFTAHEEIPYRRAMISALKVIAQSSFDLDHPHPDGGKYVETEFAKNLHRELAATPTNIQTGGVVPRATLQYAQECLANFDGNDPGDEDDTREVEPPCHCHKPWNFGHEAGCAWKKWKDAGGASGKE